MARYRFPLCFGTGNKISSNIILFAKYIFGYPNCDKFIRLTHNISHKFTSKIVTVTLLFNKILDIYSKSTLYRNSILQLRNGFKTVILKQN